MRVAGPEYGVDPPASQCDADAAGPRERGSIKLQPAGDAPARQAAVADHDIRLAACLGQFTRGNAVGAASGKHAPGSSISRNGRQAQVAIAARVRLLAQQLRHVIDPANLREHGLGIIAGPITQHRHPAIRQAHGDMAAITSDEQIGRRRHSRP
jgi:hypothetical protein